MPKEKMEDLIAGTATADYADDYTVAINLTDEKCKAARMFSLQQLTLLFNLLLRRSHVKYNLDKNGTETKVL